MKQKSVVVTGGNRGIGISITKAFVNAGYHVVVGARKDNNLNERFGDSVTFVPMDVREASAHRELTQIAINKTGGLNAYINNAGFSEWRPISEIDDDFLDTIIATNLKGAFWGCQAAVAAMGDHGGAIVNISSLAGKRGSNNNSAYCATKFGMNGLTQALAKEVGKKSIRVNALCPVLITTDGLIEALQSPHAPAGGDPEAFIANFNAANSALGRLPTGADVGAMSVFLTSTEAAAITGQCINVDCGVLPQ